MKKVHFCIYTFVFLLFSSPFWGSQLSRSAGKNRSGLLLSDSVVADSAKKQLAPVGNVKADSLAQDSTAQDSVPKKAALDAPVDYTANDSIVFSSGNMGYLYGDSKVDYQTMSIKAENISMSMDSSIVHATYGLDSIGKEFGYPVFSDNGTEYEMKNVSYNFKSKKGYIRHVITQQGEGYIVADKAKKNPDDTFFMCDGKYTTCDDHEHPHFYMMLTKAKVRPKKNVITGPAYLVIEDLPLPLAIPFGFFPFSEKYSSGIIMPSYGDDMDRGFNLRDGGYYFAVNDNFDLALTGEIYTKGSWGISARSNYKYRYRRSGSFNMTYLYTKIGDRDIPDSFSESKDFSLNWTHTQDPKANMYRQLQASVNYQTSSFNHNSLDQIANMRTESTRSSSISLTQSFPDSPFIIGLTATANQSAQDSSVSLTLPDLTVTMSRIYPFKRKMAAGAEKWYEKVSLDYSFQFKNSISTKDDKLLKSNLVKDWQNAAKHRVSAGATFNLFNYLNISPNITYNERWYTRKVSKAWDPLSSRMVAADTTYGFHRVYDFNYSISLQTKLYGFYEPVFKIGKLQKIRHVFTPSISYSGSPDFSQSKYGAYVGYSYYNADGELVKNTYSPYEGGIFGYPSSGKQGSITFGFDNNIEMKVATDNDSTKIISLIDNLGISFSYNMAADKYKWSDIVTNTRLKLSKNLTVNINAVFDPYVYGLDSKNTPVKLDQLRISKYGTIGRLKSTGYSISPSINQDTFKKWFGKGGDKDSKGKKEPRPGDENLDENTEDTEETGPRQSLFSKKKESGTYDDDGYQRNEIKWNLSFSYSMNYGYGDFDYEKLEYKGKIRQNLSFNGSIQPTKNWNFSFTSAYDFDAKKVTYMNCNISRNLHCWNISASLVPFGDYTSYFVTLRVNSSMLQDLKYEKRGRKTSYDPAWD